MLVFNYGVFFEENTKIKYFDRFKHSFWHFKKKNMITDFLKLLDLFFSFLQNIRKNGNLHVLGFNYGVFVQKHEN